MTVERKGAWHALDSAVYHFRARCRSGRRIKFSNRREGMGPPGESLDACLECLQIEREYPSADRSPTDGRSI